MLFSGTDLILQCARRFEELKLTGGFPHVDNQCNTLTERTTSLSDSPCTLLEPEGPVETGGGRGTGQSVTALQISSDELY